METYSPVEIIKTFQRKGISLFTLADFARLFKITNQNTVYKKIQRLEKKEVIRKLTKGRYLFALKKPDEFAIANFLYQPSYVSLESALSFYGIITGFPYQITSVTTKKTKTYVLGQKEYQYAQINKDLFWGYEKKEGFLIAQKEKALLDFLYLTLKGLRSEEMEEFDLSTVNKKRFKSYLKMTKNKRLLKFIQKKLKL